MKRMLLRRAVYVCISVTFLLTNVVWPSVVFGNASHYVSLINAYGEPYDPQDAFTQLFPAAGFPADSQKIFVDNTQENNHNTYTIDSQGNVYGVGNNSCGELSDPSLVGDFRDTAIQIPGLEDVIDIAEIDVGVELGGSAVFALKSDGSVWSWGCNKFLARETDPEQAFYSEPQLTPALSNITQLAAGSEHILALTQSGSIYGWGKNVCGQTGTQELELNEPNDCQLGAVEDNPQLVVGINNAINVVAGVFFSAALLTDGTVMQWGKMHNIEGLALVFPTIPTPQPVDMQNVENIIAGGYALYMQRTDGTVYGFGADSFGSLGATAASEPKADGQFYTTAPIAIPALDSSTKLWAGVNYVVGRLGNQLISLGGRGRCNAEDDPHPLCDEDPSQLYLPYTLALLSDVVVDMAIVRGEVNYVLTSLPLPDVTPPITGEPNWTINPKRTDQQSILTISATDDISGVASIELFLCGEDPGIGNGLPMNIDGTNHTFFADESTPEGTYDICARAIDNAGNASEIVATQLIVNNTSLDTVAPIVTGSSSSSANAAGWHRTPVAINWIVNDPAPSSGTPTTPLPTVADLEGVNTYTSGQSCDPANNCATGTYEVKLDTGLPGGTFTGSTAVIRFLGRTISGTATDATSGVTRITLYVGATTLTSDSGGGINLSCNDNFTSCTWTAVASMLPFGVNTYTLTVTDKADNTASFTRQYNVI